MRKIRNIIAIVLALLMLTALMPSTVFAEEISDTTQIHIEGDCKYSEAFEVLDLVNEIRRDLGLIELKMDPFFFDAAMQRAAETAVNFSHTRPDGSGCYTVCSGVYGENIAAGYVDAEAVVQGWKDSPGHYSNMIGSGYTSIGIGAVKHNGIMYWVQLFGNTPYSVVEVPEDVSRPFEIDLGNNNYEFIIEVPQQIYVTDKADIKIKGINSGWRTYFVVNSDTFDIKISHPDILTINAEGVYAASEGISDITATCGSIVLNAEIEAVKFAKDATRKCGDNITWEYESGSLVFTGTGEMYDYKTTYSYENGYESDVPWIDAFGVVEKVVVNEGITSIGSYAFSNFGELIDVSLPETLATVDEYAFSDCDTLASISIPDNVSYMGEGVFSDSYSLTSVDLPTGIRNIPEKMFYFCWGLESIEIPQNVEIIENYAFYSCSSLSELALPEKVAEIGYGAFSGCKALKEIEIPANVDYLTCSFDSCPALKKITVNNPVVYYQTDDVFERAKASELTVYCYKNSSTEKQCKDSSIKYEYLDSKEIKVQSQGYTVTYTGASVEDDIALDISSDCDSLAIKYSRGEEFDFGVCFDSVKELGEYYRERSKYIYEDKYYLQEAGVYPISYCVYGKGTEVASGTENIVIEKATPVFTFENAEVEVPYQFSDYGYQNCENNLINLDRIGLLSIEFSSDNETIATVDDFGSVLLHGIGECTITANFSGNNDYLPHSVSYSLRTYPSGYIETEEYDYFAEDDKTISIYCYKGNKTEITVPDEVYGLPVKDISTYSFESSDIESIVFSEGITIIRVGAFRNCEKLKEVKLNNKISTIDEIAFYGCSSLEEITIPESVTGICDKAFVNCTALKSVTIPETVTKIGERAFGYECSNYYSKTTKIEDFVIYGHINTEAERYAKENGFEFVDLDNPNPIPNPDDDKVDGEDTPNIDNTTPTNPDITEPTNPDEIVPTLPDETDQTTSTEIPDHSNPTNPEENKGILGDVNGDGKVNIKDATMIQKAAAKILSLTDDEAIRANVNSDKKVNVKDATAIQKFVAKIETGFLIGEPIVS